MSLTLVSALGVLQEHHLLREVITGQAWYASADALPEQIREQTFTAMSYDSRQVGTGCLLCCKGRFDPSYLRGLDEVGLTAYLAEKDYSQYTRACGIIVSNVRQAMSLLAALFYGRPQDKLTVIGITGTKGKTTTAYYLQAMLNASSGGKAALLSSVDNCLDGSTYQESELTTPESLDLFRLMNQAVSNGMRYLVMEVSSQAYKMDRVYGLTFDAAAFLNISPDHISPVEHPTFEDYLYCKRQITYHCQQLILGADHAYAPLVEQDAQLAGIPVTTFALEQSSGRHVSSLSNPARADWLVSPMNPGDTESNRYRIYRNGLSVGSLSLAMDGQFNAANAAAALALLSSLGISIEPALLATLGRVRIAGRMEAFHAPGIVAYVDYAHNFASTAAILDFIKEKYADQQPYITLVTGSAGGKAVDRRQEIVQAAQTRADRLILTEEDTESAQETTQDICQQMLDFVTNPDLDASITLDRTQAITQAVKAAQEHPERFDAIAIIGKGEERWIKREGKHKPYEGDDQVITRLFEEGK